MAIAVTCTHCDVRLRFKGEHAGKTTKCRACGEPLQVIGDTVPDHDVFLSYSAKDKPVADAICAALEAKRIRCWIAPRDILAGKQWAGAILDAITDTRVMVLVYSANSNSSPQVLREVDRAVSRGVTIVPFRIETTPMCKEMEYYIAAAHWLDALTPPLETHIDKLIATVQRQISPLPQGAASRLALPQTRDDAGDAIERLVPETLARQRGPSAALPSHTPVKKAVILIAAAAVLIALTIVTNQLVRGRRTTAATNPGTAPAAVSAVETFATADASPTGAIAAPSATTADVADRPGVFMLMLNDGPFSVYLNGHQVFNNGGLPARYDKVMEIPMKLNPSDFIVVRTKMFINHRFIRYAYLDANRQVVFAGHPGQTVFRRVTNSDNPVPSKPFEGSTVPTGKAGDAFVNAWARAGLPEKAQPIILPEKEVLYEVGILVPTK